MQALSYPVSCPKTPPKARDMPIAAGNNWEDPAIKRGGNYNIKSAFGQDQLREPTRTPKGRDTTPAYQRTTVMAESLRDVYESGGCGVPSPKWLTLDDKVLRFYAYWRETVMESSETDHIRKVNIQFYPQDNTMMISEPQIPNSGIQGGCILKRHRVPMCIGHKQKKSVANMSQSLTPTRIAPPEMNTEKFLTMNDLVVGEEISIYSRTYHIVDCDAFTREFLTAMGCTVPEGQPFPNDPYYTELRAKFDKKNPKRTMGPEDKSLKMNMEVMMSGRTNLHHREEIIQFKKYLADDKYVLMFKAIWEDRDNPHGDLRTFEIRLFLCDDTIEVIERNKPNAGRGVTGTAGGTFAVRRRLPKHKPSADLTFTHNTGAAGSLDNTNFYGIEDLYIGAIVNVYGRLLRLVDCDPFTRRYYKDNGVDLLPAIEVEKTYQVAGTALAPNFPPPHNGYGSEEDSLGNWKNLVLKAPKVDLQKWMDYDKILLRFVCRYHKAPTAEDTNRKFVLVYYCQDDTIQVTEIAGHNEGMTGGRFLKRQKVKKYKGEGERCIYKWDDFHVGAIFNLNGHILEVVDTDEFTRRFRYSRAHLHEAITKENVLRCLDARGGLHECGGMKCEDFLEGLDPMGQDFAVQVVLDVMDKYDKDHGGGVLVREFFQGVTGDATAALADTDLNGTESPNLAKLKAHRRCQIIAYGGLEKLRQAMLEAKLTYSDIFRMVSTFKLSKGANVGSTGINSIHATINPYQMFTACQELFKIELSPEEVQNMQEEIFAGRKVIPQADFITLMTRVEHFGGLPPLRDPARSAGH
mmetsp:Transcript_107887/g.186034  ORF Transcript_107887/g.186034 Transcript_107887/m.186034 type:complete len:803 (-) Transcript_107887:1588-3996(-)